MSSLKPMRLSSVGATPEGFTLWVTAEGSNRAREVRISERQALGLIRQLAEVLERRA